MPPDQGLFKRRQWSGKGPNYGNLAGSTGTIVSRIRPKKGSGPGGWNRKRSKKRSQGKGQSRRGF